MAVKRKRLMPGEGSSLGNLVWKTVGATVGIALLFPVPFNIARHNHVEESGNITTATKIDGGYSFTEFQRREDGYVCIRHYSPMASVYGSDFLRFYADRDGDGRVDDIVIADDSAHWAKHTQRYTREQDYVSHTSLFSEADAHLEEQIGRFEDILR